MKIITNDAVALKSKAKRDIVENNLMTQAVALGDSSVVLAGGMESMSK